MARSRFCFCLLMILIAAFYGCSGRPSAVKPIDVDAGDAAAEAIELYDKDGDNALNDRELAAVPGILKWKKLYDANSDGNISEDEIETRISDWQGRKRLGFTSLSVTVTLDGRPLPGATVEFIPEPYLEPSVKPGSGKTDQRGVASITVAKEDLPAALQNRPGNFRGMTSGTFKVKIKHPSTKLPTKYTDGTALGAEVAMDTLSSVLLLELKSRG